VDARGQMLKETDPHGKSFTYAYDDAGRLTKIVDRLGRVREFTYFDDNLLQQETWKDTEAGSVVWTRSFIYDANDQLLTATDDNGTYTLTYDELNRLATIQDPWSITLTNTWDAGDRLTQVTDTKGGTREYTYDDANRNTVRKFSATGQAARLDITYNDRNDVTELKRYSDVTGTTLVGSTVFAYDDARRVTGITHKNGAGTTIDSFSYQFDNDDKVTQETSTLGPTRNYTYDDSDQLTGDGASTWSYDLNGNRTNTGYNTDTGNRLTTDGTWNYTYDDEGNVTVKEDATTSETWTFTYNQLNQLTKAEHQPTSSDPVDKRIEFKYDVFGNRIEKSYDADGDGSGTATLTRFAYEGANAWADLDSANNLQKRRLYLDGVDALFARLGSSGNPDWYLTDRLGSVRDIMNNSDSIIDHIDYDAFGVVTNETSPSNGDRYKFTGREYDSELHNLAYYRARYYRFDVGLWQSEDPIRFGAGDSNLYRYVSNNATNATDPTGLDQWSDRGDHQVDQARMYAEHFGADPEAAERNAREYWALRERMVRYVNIPGRTDWWLPANYYNRPWYHNYAAGIAGIAEDVGGFAAGFAEGVRRGGTEFFGGVADLVAGLPGSVRRIIDGISNLINLIGDGQWNAAARAAFPEIYDLVTGWSAASPFSRGLLAGQVVGKYGAAILTGYVANQTARLIHTTRAGGAMLQPAVGPPISGGAGAAVATPLAPGAIIAGGGLLMTLPPGDGRDPSRARYTSDENSVFQHLESYHGIPRHVSSDRLHRIKQSAGRGPADNVLFDYTGNVYDPSTLEWLGSLTSPV
jgi:RHS repeat-associated protein